MKLVYFIQDLSDPAAVRRVEMLLAGGAEVTAVGFRRDAEPVATIAGIPAIDLGESRDADLAHRARLVAKYTLGARRFQDLLQGADVVLARNLDMLVIAAAARRISAPQAKLVYECLDIHSSMVGSGLRARMMRKIEAALLKACSLLVISSPGFIREYFSVQYKRLPRTLLLENKVLRSTETAVVRPDFARAPGPPWRIGLFGKIRCRESVDLLKQIVVQAGGDVEVVLRGRPMANLFVDLAAEVAGLPNVSFLGPYTYDDLDAIYADVHFMWGADYYDTGSNSKWLLPNRLYEGGYGNAPIIADRKTETANWLTSHHAGLLFTDAVPEVVAFLKQLDPAGYAELERRSRAIPTGDLVCDREECRRVVAALGS